MEPAASAAVVLMFALAHSIVNAPMHNAVHGNPRDGNFSLEFCFKSVFECDGKTKNPARGGVCGGGYAL